MMRWRGSRSRLRKGGFTVAKVLVVDDAPVIRLLLKRILHPLEKQGVVVFFAEDGFDALQIIEREHPELVFLDIMMMGKSGFEVCETVKKAWRWDDVHVVLLSAKGQNSDKERGVRVGADGYMTKPFEPGEILAKVREVLNIPG